MSLTRAMRRRADRQRDTADRRWPRAGSISKLQPDGSILALRPTKGWVRTSAKRVALRIEQARLHAVALAANLGATPGVAEAAAGIAVAAGAA